MPIYVKNNGNWAEADCGQARHLSIWKDVKEVLVKYNGEWQRVCKRPVSYTYSGTLTVGAREVGSYYFYGFMSLGASYGAAYSPAPSGNPRLSEVYWHEASSGRRYLVCYFSAGFDVSGTVKVKIGATTFTVPHLVNNRQYQLQITQAQFDALPKSGKVSIVVTYND